MINKIILLVTIALVFAFQTQAQVKPKTVLEVPTGQLQVKPQITKIDLVVDSIVSYHNNLDHWTIIYHTATVYSVGIASVSFSWFCQPDDRRLPASHYPDHFVLNGTGVDVMHSVSWVEVPYHSTITMRTDLPNVITSNSIHF